MPVGAFIDFHTAFGDNAMFLLLRILLFRFL